MPAAPKNSNDAAEAHAFTKQVLQTLWAELREFVRTVKGKSA